MRQYHYLLTLLREKNTEAHLYVYGLIIGVALAMTYVALSFWPLSGFNNSCPFRALTGLYCPGCGGTRSIQFFFHGDLYHSLIYNPGALWLILITMAFYLSQSLHILTLGKIPGLKYHSSYLLVLVVLLVVNVIIKNYLLLVHGISIVP